MKHYDAIIIGGGFAGTSAAIWLGRYRRRTLVISAGPHRNAAATVMHGYPGSDGQNPDELLQKMHAEAAAYATTEFVDEYATAAEKTSDKTFIVRTRDAQYAASSLLIATGTADERPDFTGFDRFNGKTAWHCPACDGYEVSGKTIAVIGWHEDIGGYAKEFLPYTDPQNITIYTQGRDSDLDPKVRRDASSAGIRLQTIPISELRGTDGKLETLVLDDSSTVPCNALFYNISQRARLQLLNELGCELEEGAVKVDQKQQTTIEGVYAAGDITPFQDLVVVACSTGAVAASSIHESLMSI